MTRRATQVVTMVGLAILAGWLSWSIFAQPDSGIDWPAGARIWVVIIAGAFGGAGGFAAIRLWSALWRSGRRSQAEPSEQPLPDTSAKRK